MKRVLFDPGKITLTSQPSPAEEALLEQLADAELESGAGVSLQETVAWVESWFTPNERPAPKARKLD